MNNNNISIENARIIYRNFAGKESRFNPAGRRSFAVVLTEEEGRDFEARGYNVKFREPRTPDEEPSATLPVFVRFDQFPPEIYRVGKHGKLLLDEKTVACLDYEDLLGCDIVISPYRWEVNGKTGVKAYVKKLYANVDEDPFADKYSNVQTNGVNEGTPDEEELPF